MESTTLYDTIAEALRADREDAKAGLLTDIPAHMFPEPRPAFRLFLNSCDQEA